MSSPIGAGAIESTRGPRAGLPIVRSARLREARSSGSLSITRRVEEERVHRLTKDDLIPDTPILSSNEDQFEHKRLAQVVADAIRIDCDDSERARDSGLNIALYGPWGSGKTGFFALLREKLSEQNLEVIRYDAWKYDTDSLQRHFLTQVATELDVEVPDLYAVSEGKRIDSARLNWARLRRLFSSVFFWASLAASAVIALAVLAALVTAAWHAALYHHGVWPDLKSHFQHERLRLAKYLLAPAVALAIGAAMLRVIIAESLVTYRRDAPSEEEFEQVFEELLERKRKKLGTAKSSETRFVFFVDELDRCRKDEVVTTLHAIKNFLGKPGCVFLVAADRDVLEEALTELPQSNPAILEAPFYSSASEYLDKVFHRQLSLPPLRLQRRTKFARDLVAGRDKGLWAELEQSEKLDDVLFVLIPQHAQSPRRVKTLLTNYALNARAAEARDLNWLERAYEIAKLTAFQTEFPLFARDLPQAPQLPVWLLDAAPPDVNLTLQQLELLKLHKLSAKWPPDEEGVPNEEEEAEPSEARAPELDTNLTPTDRILLSEDDPDRDRLINEQRAQLRRYLEDRTGFQNPRRDLLHLESAGEFVGLENSDIAATVESDAPENSELVKQALEGCSQEELKAVIRLLKNLFPDYRGTQRDNLVKSLSLALWKLEPLDAEDAGFIAEALLQPGTRFEAFEKRDLPKVAEAGVIAGAPELVSRVLADERTLSTPNNVLHVAAYYDRLPDDSLDEVEEKVVEYFDGDHNVLFYALERLPEAAGERLLDKTFSATIGAAEAPPPDGAEEEARRSLGEIASELLQAATRSGPSLSATAFALLLGLKSSAVYPILHDHSPAILGNPSSQPRALELALGGFAEAPPSDWVGWLNLAEGADLQRGADSDRKYARLGICALAAVFEKFRSVPELQETCPELVLRISKVAGITASDLESEDLQAAINTAISEPGWSADADRAEVQRRLHDTTRALGELPGALGQALHNDLLNEAGPAVPRPPGVTPATTYAALVAPLTENAPPLEAEEVAEKVASARPAGPDRTYALAIIAASLVRRGVSISKSDWFDLTPDSIVECVRQEGMDCLRQWLDTGPPLPSAIEVARRLGLKAITTVTTWLEGQSRDVRTRFLQGMVGALLDSSKWIAAVEDFDSKAVAETIESRVAGEGRAGRRRLLADSLIALGDQAIDAMPAATGVVISLLNHKTKSDFPVAIRVMSELRLQPPEARVRALQTSINRAARKTKLKVPRAVVETSGLQITSKYVE